LRATSSGERGLSRHSQNDDGGRRCPEAAFRAAPVRRHQNKAAISTHYYQPCAAVGRLKKAGTPKNASAITALRIQTILK